ncbi:glycosyltransferase family 4 protein [Paludibaculum fermentans]|uniref:Glycosyltransferase family 4 protein n=2 Tax=Paludibaculum fermentans TaxID=1473598 RepID=A0A7S7SN70_PALFE|nr:glycosyltransferase family 4 protein [Paludibaculum fermentans]
MHYAVPRILAAEGQLARLFTDICAVQGWPRLLKWLPNGVLPPGVRRLKGRIPRGVPHEQLTSFTGFGWEYVQKRRQARSAEQMTAAHLWAGARFNELVLRQGLGEARGVYTFNSAGLSVLESARQRGLRAVMEQTIAPTEVEARLMREEWTRHGQWGSGGFEENGLLREFGALEAAEWNAAQVIVCGSEFVREGIREAGGPWEKCVVVPYGVDCPPGRVRQKPRGPLRVLFVGTVGLRKGVPYLLAAAELFGADSCEFRLIGSIDVSADRLAGLPGHVQVLGSVPRAEMKRHWDWADVFVLPSLCEGSATVCYEALGAGLPVITTPNAGSVVRDGVDGFVVPVRDGNAIAGRLEKFMKHDGLLESMSKQALLRAQSFTVAKYGERLTEALLG